MKKSNEIRVLGPPGCGKTTYLQSEISRTAEQIGGEQILVSSFTKAAAQELLSRNLPIPSANIGTLHALCYRKLGYPEIAENHIKEFNEENSSFAMTSQSGNMDVGIADQKYNTPWDKIFAEYQIMRARLKPEYAWKESIQLLHKRWSDFKIKYGYLDYTDMIEQGIEQMKFPPNNTTMGIVDEAQDLTPLQMKLVRQWGEKMKWLVLAGDVDQLLFDFSGATPEAFMYPELPPERMKVLPQSYRIPRVVHGPAEKWISQCRNRIQREYRPRDFEGELRKLNASLNNPQIVIEDAQDQVEKGKTVMILATCGYMLNDLIAGLREAGIPFSNYFRTKDRKWNPLLSGKGTSTKDRLLEYVEPKGPYFAGHRVWTSEQIALWSQVLKTKNIMKRGAKKRLKDIDKEVLSDRQLFEILIESFEAEALDQAIRCDPQWLLDNATEQYKNVLQFPIRVMERGGKEKFNEANRITIGTVHSVKGGGRDIVYLAPDLSMQAYKTGWQFPHTPGWNSIVRTMYVGMTRCKEQLVFLNPVNKMHVKGLA